MGHIIGLKPEAQMGLDIARPYISPPLIRAQFSGTNQGIQGANGYLRSSTGRYWMVKEPINAPSKGMLRLIVHSAAIII